MDAIHADDAHCSGTILASVSRAVSAKTPPSLLYSRCARTLRDLGDEDAAKEMSMHLFIRVAQRRLALFFPLLLMIIANVLMRSSRGHCAPHATHAREGAQAGVVRISAALTPIPPTYAGWAYVLALRRLYAGVCMRQ
ncbi:hypothetical protein GGX14DRAFT_577192 [Mycena pura]|uniref:Uncharacterized protein n=1 Tax=Mycena pura TaxID=153505 RepID=A0AAD6XZ86_9AGAR|nr:hypothetical protein GGX14DRAFT_577192 [Mycena pura]